MSLAISLDVIEELAELLGREAVLSARSDLVVYECDGFVIEKNCPDVVVFPGTTEQVAGVVQICNRNGLAFCPAGQAPAWPAAACRSAAA